MTINGFETVTNNNFEILRNDYLLYFKVYVTDLRYRSTVPLTVLLQKVYYLFRLYHYYYYF